MQVLWMTEVRSERVMNHLAGLCFWLHQLSESAAHMSDVAFCAFRIDPDILPWSAHSEIVTGGWHVWNPTGHCLATVFATQALRPALPTSTIA